MNMVLLARSGERQDKRCIMSIDIAGDEVRCGLGDRIKCSGSEKDKERCPFWRNVSELGKLLTFGPAGGK